MNQEKTETVKKAVYRKPPVIKQTVTSTYRLLKANPLLVLKDKKPVQADGFEWNGLKIPRSVVLPNKSEILESEKKPIASTEPSKLVTKRSSVKTTQKPTVLFRPPSTNRSKPTSNGVPPKNNFTTKYPAPASRPVQSNMVKKGFDIAKPMVAPSVNAFKKLEKSGKPRRSLSAEHYDRKKGIMKTTLQKSESAQSLNDIKKPALLSAISPIVEEKRRVVFKTPTANCRRSVSNGAFTSTPYYKHYVSTPGPSMDDLYRRLQEWLRKHKKPVGSYGHLKCFGLNNNSIAALQLNEENKENIEELNEKKTDSYENLRITAPDVPVCTSTNNYEDNRTVAQAALADLHKLISDGYPHEQCESWLGMIQRKYKDLEEEPQYWECRAAIEQTRGNITSAVECLQTAIVQGAEVQSVDNSLEQLLQKFSLLNITTTNGKNRVKDDPAKKDRARIVLDARNVFKSSIIQFAVQERKLKKKQQLEVTVDKKYLATPVRRSTRISRSGYVVTPGMQVCNSLRDLDDNIRESIHFCNNIALVDKSPF